ncbi:uncharacterized protein [Elaeis guineensis]|uniref:uncharacterized protein n=1 Tax=Elaeis guineensis var. tenera TaxID=51953 RepID=UPI003C6D1B2E
MNQTSTVSARPPPTPSSFPFLAPLVHFSSLVIFLASNNSLLRDKIKEMRRRTRREEEEEEEPVSFTKGDSTIRKSCMENSKEKTRVSDSHEDPVPPSESLQMENSKQLVAFDMSSKNGGGGKIECSNNPESSQSEASSKGPSVEDCGREKLKRHRMEMAGRVWIPEGWGQESLLKDWIDCAAFDRSLVPKGLTLAREALVDECQQSNSGSLRIENQC